MLLGKRGFQQIWKKFKVNVGRQTMKKFMGNVILLIRNAIKNLQRKINKGFFVLEI